MPRLPSLLDRPIGFAHGGAASVEPPQSRTAFELAIRVGATGLAAKLWATEDGHAVVHATGSSRGRVRRRSLADLPLAELGDEALGVDELVVLCGTDHQLCLDVADERSVLEAIAVARDHDFEDRLWLRHGSIRALTEWRALSPRCRLLHVARTDRMERGTERHVAQLEASGIDALELHESEWTGGTVALVHRFGVLAVGDDAQHPRMLDGLLDAGIDAVRSDHVDRMVEAIALRYG